MLKTETTGRLTIRKKVVCTSSSEKKRRNKMEYRGSPPYAFFGTWKKPCYMKLMLVGLYCGPLLTLIPPLTRTSAKKRVSGNRVSDFRVSGGPPVLCVKVDIAEFFWKMQ